MIPFEIFVCRSLFSLHSQSEHRLILFCKRCICLVLSICSVLLHYFCAAFIVKIGSYCRCCLCCCCITTDYCVVKYNVPKWVQILMSSWFVFFSCYKVQFCRRFLNKIRRRKKKKYDEKKVLMLLSFVVVVPILVAFIDT